MVYKNLEFDQLAINPANDRHGELENETAAIGWLFANKQQHMLNLAKDLVERGTLYEPPLVWPSEDGKFVVFDGNRRVTCLKLLKSPKRAPNAEMQEQFKKLRAAWQGEFPDRIQCQIETDRERIDAILYRRHTGSQNGVGQSNWDDRMKATFVTRTGMGGGFNVADEVERRLKAAKLEPRKPIPRSTMNRLLSSEVVRNRLGFSIVKGRFSLRHDEDVVLKALSRVARDLVERNVVLNDVWDIERKRIYIDKLETEGLLPSAANAMSRTKAPPPKAGIAKPPVLPAPAAPPARRTTLIPQIAYPLPWPGRLARLKSIWEELQFKLELVEHPNAISVLFRVLFELSIDNYITQEKLPGMSPNDSLAKKAQAAGAHLEAKGKISAKYALEIRKLSNIDVLFSVSTMNSYVHSPNFAPSPEHLAAMWDSASELVVQCLNV